MLGRSSQAQVKIEQKMKDVDVILEVRDARAPFTSAQLPGVSIEDMFVGSRKPKRFKV